MKGSGVPFNLRAVDGSSVVRLVDGTGTTCITVSIANSVPGGEHGPEIVASRSDRPIPGVAMKSLTSIAVLLMALSVPTPALSGLVYSNATTDTQLSYIYSVGPYSQIGDVVSLAGTERTLTDASVQFYNVGSAGTFDAVLRLYEAGPSVGTLLGSYQLSGLSIGGGDILTVTFGGLNLVVPDQIAFAVEVANVASAVDLGLNVFQPPTVGTSSDTHFLVNSGSGLVEALAAAGGGNLYFVANAARAVPEPAALGLAALGFAFAMRAARRR